MCVVAISIIDRCVPLLTKNREVGVMLTRSHAVVVMLEGCLQCSLRNCGQCSGETLGCCSAARKVYGRGWQVTHSSSPEDQVINTNWIEPHLCFLPTALKYKCSGLGSSTDSGHVVCCISCIFVGLHRLFQNTSPAKYKEHTSCIFSCPHKHRNYRTQI